MLNNTERQKRTKITIYIDSKAIQEAANQLNRFTAYEREEITLTPEEMGRYNQYQEHMKPIYEKFERQRKAIRKSQMSITLGINSGACSGS